MRRRVWFQHEKYQNDYQNSFQIISCLEKETCDSRVSIHIIVALVICTFLLLSYRFFGLFALMLKHEKRFPPNTFIYECVCSVGFSIYEFCTLLVVPLKLNNCRWMSQSDNPQYVCLFLVCLFSWCSFLNRNSCLRQKKDSRTLET